MRFADVIGHEELKAQLRSAVGAGRISHAQLFSGEAGYGTLALALAYAQYVNCPNRTEDDSCGVCASCHQMGELSHPDLHLVMPVNKAGKKGGEAMLSDEFVAQWRGLVRSSGGYLSAEEWYDSLDLGKTLKGIISTKEADEIIRKLSFKSYSSGYKVMVIWQADMLKEEAANKILKILEEPWERTLFLLISDHSERLLDTIISRTQRVDVPRISEFDLAEYAKSQGVREPQRIKALSRLSGGDILELRSMMSGGGDEQRGENFRLFTSLMRLSYNDKHLELLTWAEDVASLSRDGQRSLMRYSLGLLREAYILHAGLHEISYLWGEEADFCKKFAPFIGNENIEFLVDQIELALRQINQNGNPTIVFTHFALIVSKQINRLK